MTHPDPKFIRVNRILGKQASFGFIPAEQFIAWIAIAIVCYTLTNGFLSLGLAWFFGLSLWLILSWWLVTGNRPYEFTDTLRSPPGEDWYVGSKRYVSPVPEFRPDEVRSHATKKLKPLVISNPEGGKSTFMPFENELDLQCLVEIQKDDRRVGAFLLKKKKSYQLVFGFDFQGLHDILFDSEVNAVAQAIEEGMKDIPFGEKMTFCTGCYSEDQTRQAELSHQVKTCNLAPIALLLENEQRRVQQLKLKGIRQIWKQTIFCTWTSNSAADSSRVDPVSALVRIVEAGWRTLTGWLTGSGSVHRQDFFKKLLINGWQEGFLVWSLLINTKMDFQTQTLDAEQLWQWLWTRTNNCPAPKLPHCLYLIEVEGRFVLTETHTSDKDTATLLIEGQNGLSACPEHRQNRDRLYLPGKNKVLGVVTMLDPPLGWTSAREQIRWMWKVLSASHVYDTEAWVEIGAENRFLVQDNLSRQAKQSKSAKTRAILKGQGRDIGAEVKEDESFEAQRRLCEGARPLSCGSAFLVYRNSAESLDAACNTIANSFDTAKLNRERKIAWDIWLQTLPITTKWILHSSDGLTKRRLTPDTHSVAGFLPITVPKPLDSTGVEFLTRQGGKPIYVDIFKQQIGRVLITGTSGSGKSVVGWRFMLEALAHNIPVVGMDLSYGSNSTFKIAIELLGDQGAYYDLRDGSLNLLEPPNLRPFHQRDRIRRRETWKEFIRRALNAIALGKQADPALAQQVDKVVLRAIEVFLSDDDIIYRYNEALKQGWKSEAWQQMPTLHDFLRFCTKERLNFKSYDAATQEGINQVAGQIEALLSSALGKAIGQPSTFSPEPMVKFFALNNLSDHDAYLMSISAHTACIRTALSYPQSLFMGDELSVLLRKEGFASIVGELLATGRKEGISVVLLAQDPDTICECSSGAQIMQNLSHRITGRITSNSIASFQKYLGYPAAIIGQNATESWLPKRHELRSNWLIEANGTFWQVGFYPGEQTLAAVANTQAEIALRTQIMAKYPTTEWGKMSAIAEFASRLAVLEESKHQSLSNIKPMSVSSQPESENHRSPIAS